MKNMLNPDKVSFTISIYTKSGKKLKNTDVKLIGIDDSYYTDKRKTYEYTTNDEGKINIISINEGVYIFQIFFKKKYFEYIHYVKNNSIIKIELPILLGLFFKEKRVSDEEVEGVFEDVRTDKKFCFKCKTEKKSGLGWWKCKYCKRWYCNDCRIPENHNCKGLLVSPPKRFRVEYSKYGTKYSP